MAVQKITEEEKQKLQLMPIGKRGRRHPVRHMLQTMAVNEIISVDKEDFKWKNRTPQFFISQLTRGSKKKFSLWAKQDGSGWVIQRMK
jgi:hypothetical protein